MEAGIAYPGLKRGNPVNRLLWSMILPPEGQKMAPTAPGYMVVLVSVGIAAAAYNTAAASNILFIALSLLLSSFIASIFLIWLNFRGIRWRLVTPAHLRAGELAVVQLEIMNLKRFIPSYSIWFRVQAKMQDESRRLMLNSRLDAGGKASLDWEFTPTRRGVETLRTGGVESQFPFGFLYKITGGQVMRRVVVYPPRIPYRFQPPSGHHSHLQGEILKRPGGGTELVNIRDYRRGDPQRMVHWKATARLQNLMVRQTSEENRDGYILLLETPASLWSDSLQLDLLCAFAASLAEDLFTEGRMLGSAINHEPMVRMKRLSDLHAFMDRLARLQTVDIPPIGGDGGGPNLLTFKPGLKGGVYACVGGIQAGEAQPA